VDELQKF